MNAIYQDQKINISFDTNELKSWYMNSKISFSDREEEKNSIKIVFEKWEIKLDLNTFTYQIWEISHSFNLNNLSIKYFETIFSNLYWKVNNIYIDKSYKYLFEKHKNCINIEAYLKQNKDSIDFLLANK